ncbi:hypothetical protein O3P69_008235 [Scylla paramamosain]|uniref:Uncharacterized protein n=1 Tax=Scylla paramamosain TaxID=85552 RepID=A0AAW0T2Y2_SCYPA
MYVDVAKLNLTLYSGADVVLSVGFGKYPYHRSRRGTDSAGAPLRKIQCPSVVTVTRRQLVPVKKDGAGGGRAAFIRVVWEMHSLILTRLVRVLKKLSRNLKLKIRLESHRCKRRYSGGRRQISRHLKSNISSGKYLCTRRLQNGRASASPTPRPTSSHPTPPPSHITLSHLTPPLPALRHTISNASPQTSFVEPSIAAATSARERRRPSPS